MNTKHLINLPEVFVSFDAEKIEGCNVVYLNKTLAAGKDSAAIRDGYSYVVNAGSTSHKGQPMVKTFMAERYGGGGIARNGGGGRCGFDGVWQLKGLGPNRLIGEQTHAANGDGNQCLDKALYESIWAEIIDAALPYGAVRTVAILDTGLTYDHYGKQRTRGLIVREPAVRPAHFIRAIYFKQKHPDTLGEDAQRVKSVIRRLAEFLPSAGSIATQSSQYERLEGGLIELAARYAKQFAISRAKHISHNNVSESNISLEGAWLDLTGARLFTHAADTDRKETERFNTEYAPAIDSLQSLCYYLGKYSVIPTATTTRLFREVVGHFTEQYYKHLRLYEVAQVGFPLWILEPLIDSVEFAAFSGDLLALLERDDFTVHACGSVDGWEGYERWTKRVYIELLTAKARKGPFVSQAVSDVQAQQLSSSFNKLFDLACATATDQGISQQSFYRCIAINATRLNRSPLVLHTLEARIEGIKSRLPQDRISAHQALTAEVLLATKMHLGSEEQHIIPLWLSDTLSIEFDPRSALFTIKMIDQCVLTIDTLFAFSSGHREVRTAVQFYCEAWGIPNE